MLSSVFLRLQMPIQDSVNLKNGLQSISLPVTVAATTTGNLLGVYSTLADNIEDNIRHVEGQLQDFTL